MNNQFYSDEIKQILQELSDPDQYRWQDVFSLFDNYNFRVSNFVNYKRFLAVATIWGSLGLWKLCE